MISGWEGWMIGRMGEGGGVRIMFVIRVFKSYIVSFINGI